MLKHILIAGLGLLFSTSSFAQDYTSTADSDPAAKKILDQVRVKYDAYNSIEANFTLAIEFPEQPTEVQEGTMARNGNKYRILFGGNEVFSDGEVLYMVIHNNKSVQISDAPDSEEEAGSLLSPESIFNFYDNGDYIYSLIDTQTEGGKVVHIIEFKPSDRNNSEYTKLRMVVARDSREIVRVKAFSRDGSRYTFQIKNLNPNKRFAADYFTFNKAKYPDYYVEDLRD